MKTTPVKPPYVLVALPQLTDPNFRKAVVLVIEHNVNGTMGFIINRPSKMSVKDLVVMDDIDIPPQIPAWYGGPVGMDNGLVVHNQRDDDYSPVTHYQDGQINVSSSMYALKGLISAANITQDEVKPFKATPCIYPYRFIVGYAGWEPGQLDLELRMGAWLQLPIDDQLLFNTPWQAMWESALGSIGADPAGFVSVQHSYLN